MRKKGFTLIEIIVTIGLFCILAVVVFAMITNGQRSYLVGKEKIDYKEQVAHAVRDFEKYTRGATLLETAEADHLVFYAYQAGDNHPAPSKFEYFLSNGELLRSIIKPVLVGTNYEYAESSEETRRVAKNVLGSNLFSYFNETGEELALPPQLDVVKMIKIEISVDKYPGNPPGHETDSTSIQLRNMKTNL